MKRTILAFAAIAILNHTNAQVSDVSESTSPIWTNTIVNECTYSIDGPDLYPEDKITRTYNGNGDETHYLLQSTYDYGQTWTNRERKTSNYDTNGNMTEELSESWDATNLQWIITNKGSFTYDSNNNPIEIIYQDWTGTAWENTSRYVEVYDLDNNRTQSTKYLWNNNAWENNAKAVYDYDSNNNWIEYVQSNWNSIDATWDDNLKIVSTYNASNERTAFETYQWVNSQWEITRRDLYTYGNSSDTIIRQNWSASALNLVNWYRYTRNYDSNGNETEYLQENWDTSNSEWEYNVKESSTYDADDNMISRLTQSWQSGFTSSYWEDVDLWEVCGSSSTVSISEQSQVLLKTFPNPADDVLNIQTEEKVQQVEVYNIQGAKVLVDNRTQLNISELPSGTYVINVITQNSISKSRFVKN